jgi:hypothetical protein
VAHVLDGEPAPTSPEHALMVNRMKKMTIFRAADDGLHAHR